MYFPLAKISISLLSLSSTEPKMIYFEVKMTGYDKQYTFTYTHPHRPQESHTHPNSQKSEGKTQIVRLLKLVLKSKVSADPF